MFSKKALMAAVVALSCGSAVAAERIVVAALGDVNGRVMVNKGTGYVPAKPGMPVGLGDRVITLDGASAKIVYTEGCVTELTENNLLGIEGKACESKVVNPRSQPIRLAEAIGGNGGGGGGGGGAGGGLGGGMGAGLLTGLAIVTTVIVSNSDDDPISK